MQLAQTKAAVCGIAGYNICNVDTVLNMCAVLANVILRNDAGALQTQLTSRPVKDGLLSGTPATSRGSSLASLLTLS